MISDDLRKRIAALNKGGLRNNRETAEEQTPVEPPQKERDRKPIARYRHPGREKEVAAPKVPSEASAGLQAPATRSDARLHLPLEEVAQGVEVQGDAGQFLMIDRPMQALFPSAGKAFNQRYSHTISSLEEPVPHDTRGTLQPLAGAGPAGVLYVDIETTGLTANTPLFLVGALVFEAGELRLRQFLARDYSEEAALLDHFCQLLAHAQVVVSFNGKSYDLPYIRDRSFFFGVAFEFRQVHIDMLHEGRRRWKDRLPNCKLQTLERVICRRMRSGDIPGADIPDAYHRFVRTGNAVEMRDILHHNALDLVTMAEVLVFILEGREL